MEQNESTFRLVIFLPTVKDVGQYTVRFHNLESSAFLHVNTAKLKPYISIRLPETIQAFFYDTVTMQCTVSDPSENVLWYKDDEIINNDGIKYRIKKTNDGTCILTINDCIAEDKGIYTCVLEEQNDRTECELDIKEYQYKFLQKLKSQECMLMDSIQFICVLNYSHGEVQWYKNGEKLVENDRIEISKENKTRKIKIRKCQQCDTGLYKCLTNSDNTEAKLIIVCKLILTGNYKVNFLI